MIPVNTERTSNVSVHPIVSWKGAFRRHVNRCRIDRATGATNCATSAYQLDRRIESISAAKRPWEQVLNRTT